MQTIERDVPVKAGKMQRQQHLLASKDGRFGRTGKPLCANKGEDDCSGYDKLPKQMDDLIEGDSPKRFKRLKMACDIVAR